MSPVLSRYASSAWSTKMVSIVSRNEENRESDEGVSQAPDSAFPWQDCQKRFPHRFARSGLIFTNARIRPRLRRHLEDAIFSQVLDLTNFHLAANQRGVCSMSTTTIRTDSELSVRIV